MWWSKKRGPDPAEAVRGLRQKALSVSAESLHLTPGGALPNVWAVMMETAWPEVVASLFAVGDGAASLYLSHGGGVIGAGEHERVRAKVSGLLTSAEAHLALFSPATEMPYPTVGRVRFYVRTFGGTLTAEAAEDELGEGRHPLWRVFMAGHELMTSIREVSAREE